MNFDHCVYQATQRALDWDDLPEALLPLVIISEVAHLEAIDPEAMRVAPWH